MDERFYAMIARLEIVLSRVQQGLATEAQIKDEIDHIETAIELMFIATSPEDVQAELLANLQL